MIRYKLLLFANTHIKIRDTQDKISHKLDIVLNQYFSAFLPKKSCSQNAGIATIASNIYHDHSEKESRNLIRNVIANVSQNQKIISNSID
jgi:hypothetical protein